MDGVIKIKWFKAEVSNSHNKRYTFYVKLVIQPNIAFKQPIPANTAKKARK
ncbi:MAG: hypothetical protein ACI9W0_001209 [Gammaproteobacteria bacterium]|jgi:hypothetical protein